MANNSEIEEPIRRRSLEFLAKTGELPALDIYERFYLKPLAVFQHLKILREANLVKIDKSKQNHIYRINPVHGEV